MDGQDALIQRMNEIDWFHSIPLKDGIVTPGRDDSMSKMKQVCLPEDLSGKSVLDIGAWDGFFSFQAEKNGADYVAFGPMYKTMSKLKKVIEIKKIETLQKNIKLPFTLIGGINHNNINKLTKLKPNYVAIISSLWNFKHGPVKSALKFREIWRK